MKRCDRCGLNYLDHIEQCSECGEILRSWPDTRSDIVEWLAIQAGVQDNTGGA
jgi:hypothetical protein